jgi:hypothetical protein
MDYVCYREMGDEQALKLLGAISDESMYVWNDMYIGHLYLSYIGYYGKECSTLAETLIRSYIEWMRVRTKPSGGPNMSRCPGYMSDEDIIKELLSRVEICTSIREYILANNLSKDGIEEYIREYTHTLV